MSNPVSDEIKARGGPAAFAERVQQKPGTVRLWKHRGHFPRTAWPEIIAAFPDLTIDRLKEIEASPAARSNAAA